MAHFERPSVKYRIMDGELESSKNEVTSLKRNRLKLSRSVTSADK